MIFTSLIIFATPYSFGVTVPKIPTLAAFSKISFNNFPSKSFLNSKQMGIISFLGKFFHRIFQDFLIFRV